MLRVPDAVQPICAAAQRRDPWSQWAPDQQRTACAMRCIRGTISTAGKAQRREGWPMKVIDVRDMTPEQWRLGVETRMLVSSGNGAAQLCVFEQWIAPGAGAPTHSHPVEEVLTVRDGEAEMWMGEAAADRLFRPVADRAGGPHARFSQFRHRDAAHPRRAGRAVLRGDGGGGGGSHAKVEPAVARSTCSSSGWATRCRPPGNRHYLQNNSTGHVGAAKPCSSC